MPSSANSADVDTVIIFTANIEKLAGFYRSAFDLGEPQTASQEHIGFRLPSLYLGFDRMDEARNVAGGISLFRRVLQGFLQTDIHKEKTAKKTE